MDAPHDRDLLAPQQHNIVDHSAMLRSHQQSNNLQNASSLSPTSHSLPTTPATAQPFYYTPNNAGAANTSALQLRYADYLSQFHHYSNCQIKLSSHVEKFAHPFKVHNQTFDVFVLYQFVRNAGGVNQIRAWSTVARQLGFDPSKATSISFRMKKWLQDNHIDSFFNYDMGLSDGTDYSADPISPDDQGQQPGQEESFGNQNKRKSSDSPTETMYNPKRLQKIETPSDYVQDGDVRQRNRGDLDQHDLGRSEQQQQGRGRTDSLSRRNDPHFTLEVTEPSSRTATRHHGADGSNSDFGPQRSSGIQSMDPRFAGALSGPPSSAPNTPNHGWPAPNLPLPASNSSANSSRYHESAESALRNPIPRLRSVSMSSEHAPFNNAPAATSPNGVATTTESSGPPLLPRLRSSTISVPRYHSDAIIPTSPPSRKPEGGDPQQQQPQLRLQVPGANGSSATRPRAASFGNERDRFRSVRNGQGPPFPRSPLFTNPSFSGESEKEASGNHGSPNSGGPGGAAMQQRGVLQAAPLPAGTRITVVSPTTPTIAKESGGNDAVVAALRERCAALERIVAERDAKIRDLIGEVERQSGAGRW
ncbi:hypothetical protein BJ742DRAFT_779263 [Cladochytrium replicatum]|nr:hypothetical protein BJ742DRAFT_779263 [Cladochytrium replicatum]